MQSIYLAGGCFWCIESVYLSIKGVLSVTPGYMGGETANPSYSEVCKGYTGHAEVIKCDYLKKEISLESIINIFFNIHDPTQINRQGNDIGTQYRSAIFYENNNQLDIIQKAIVSAQIKWKKKIQTEVSAKKIFYSAEQYHHDYYKKNPSSMYCNILIPSKLAKLKKLFPKMFKEYY